MCTIILVHTIRWKLTKFVYIPLDKPSTLCRRLEVSVSKQAVVFVPMKDLKNSLWQQPKLNTTKQ
jgi:hypothetical protein